MIKWFTFVLLLVGASGAHEAVVPGVKPPAKIIAAAQPALAAGKQALLARDLSAVEAAVQEACTALGAWAGNPETPTEYVTPIDPSPPDVEKVRLAWLREFERGLRGVVWRKNPAGDPREMDAGLRAAAVPLAALVRSAPFATERKAEIDSAVREGAEWLLARQHVSGVFPMPVGPGLHPRDKVGFIVQRVLKEHPDIAVDGWISDDRGDGGLQFDNALCGVALVEAWSHTQDACYLAAAGRAGDWAVTQPLVPNWNYNAFSVGLLARLSRATGEGKYLSAAVEKARIGVLPGQLSSGRWFDAHNASAVYHNILLRDLLELTAALPPQHEFAEKLRDAVSRGLDQAAEETSAHGFPGTWSADFARGLMLLGERPKWRTALNICVNAALSGRGKSLGADSIAVLEEAATLAP